jgi:hypothetical protein
MKKGSFFGDGNSTSTGSGQFFINNSFFSMVRAEMDTHHQSMQNLEI